MFGSLLRSTRKGRQSETTPLLAALHKYRSRQSGHDADHSAFDGDGGGDDDAAGDMEQYDEGDEEDDEDDGGRRRDGPLLPVFSAEFLDRIPIYNTTHAIRIVVVQRCETTLSWDQLRSPQVSQFLVKPIQQQILSDHFSRGTIVCLLANCLQFRKEGESNPGNIGVCRTRALTCELLAMRLLKEFSTRELIDALSYDFNPLQGMAAQATGTMTPGGGNWGRQGARTMRISTLEIAIRAQAKKFLAHPLVVQQLEAIWAGTIVFHSVADSLHRKPDTPPNRHYSTFDRNISPGRGPSRRLSPIKPFGNAQSQPEASVRRTVTLYDPHEASLFKLSRLRVPRYRNLFSTLSFGIMLGLFLAVLNDKSDDITALEVLFWFWSAGYMLDEIVGFSEQGFGLYIMSVWNAFDLGILLMFLAYYILRLYGILMPDIGSRHHMANMAYDVLGSTAVLLFPRLFSALDHYRYFSQLLIAFRMMAMDLIAILMLIVICCSGFFVAFTLAFKKDLGPGNAAYALFQLLMGFTPAAWDLWDDYNPLGKTLLALFLFICHFLIVTILVTVLTNSFMAIVQNANEEHQFLFAVNTISMVKSDALFSYIPPTNILGWMVIPLKYCMPFKDFIRMNRLMIKLTHMPILFSIFSYERLFLSNLAYGPTDLVEQRGRSQSKVPLPAFSIRGPLDVFSPGTRLREPSITTFRKDRALEEVFRRPFRDSSFQAPSQQRSQQYQQQQQQQQQPPSGRRNSSNVVTDWMKGMGTEGGPFPPQEETRSVLDRLETRRPLLRRSKTSGQVPQRLKHPVATARNVASDPDDSITHPIVEEVEPDGIEGLPQQTDADGDDELVSNDEDEQATSPHITKTANIMEQGTKPRTGYDSSDEEYFRPPLATKPRTPARTPARTPTRASPPSPTDQQQPEQMSPSKRFVRQKPNHNRNLSTNTVLFSPPKELEETGFARSLSPTRPNRIGTRSGTATPARFDGQKTPKRPAMPGAQATRPRSILPPRDIARQNPSIGGLAINQRRPDPSFNALALDLASDLGDNRDAPNFAMMGGLPASFTTQFEMAARARAGNKDRSGSAEDSDSNRMSRIMLARMTTLEEGFRDVLKEVKGLKKGSEDGVQSVSGSRGTGGTHESQETRLGANEVYIRKERKSKGKRRMNRKDIEERMGSSL